MQKLITHPGSAHKDDFLSCAILVAETSAPIERREPTVEELENPTIAVIDIGHQHQPGLSNFDHHQFPRDATPTCSLSLVLQHLGLYEDARSFCEWLEPAEWFDCRGANQTAKWMGVDREVMFKLNSPIDHTVLRAFSKETIISPGDTLWEVMRWSGRDLLEYIRGMRTRINAMADYVQVWNLEIEGLVSPKAIFVERSDSLPSDPLQGISFFLEEQGIADQVIALVYPDSRGTGYGLKRHEDHPRVDFNALEGTPSVHFIHKSGFLAKTNETASEALKKMIYMAIT